MFTLLDTSLVAEGCYANLSFIDVGIVCLMHVECIRFQGSS